MNLRALFIAGKYKTYMISGLSLGLVYYILRLYFFDSDPVYQLLVFLGNYYLLLIESLANTLLHWSGSSIFVEDHFVVINNVQSDVFVPEIRLKKWMVLFLFLILITRVSFGRKILISLLLMLIHFVVVSLYTAYGAHLSGLAEPDFSLLTIPITLGLLALITILLFWFRNHKEAFMKSLSGLKINTRIFENETRVIIVIYIYLILSNFLFEFFDFKPLIQFLFISSQKILALLGYEAVVEPFRLVGANGSIAMIKGCLGFQTMLLFAVMVFVTGSRNKGHWIYIIAGVVFLNFVNILRFVFLFIHLQKHGDYLLAIEVHDLYNYITYFIVFILWIVWFEKFADPSPDKNITNG
jgi:exosortase/archaeosortase family protein